MKLIRLTTETNDGRFDNDYKDEIILKPNSKIALQSVAVQSDITDLTIDGDNEEVSFEVTTGDTRTIVLDHEEYNENNNHDFLNNLQLKLNQGLLYTDAQSASSFRNEIGFQMRVSINNKGKAQIDMHNTRYAYTTTNISDVFDENEAGVINFTGNPLKLASGTATGVGRSDSKHGLHSINAFTTGCGVFRLKISTWVDDGSGATSDTAGFEFGLCDSKPDTWSLPDSMPSNKKTYAIRAYQPTTAYYSKNTNSNPFASTSITPDTTTGADADVLEISIQGANIVGKVFRQGQASADNLFSTPYEVVDGVPTPLFGYIIFHGSRANIEVIDPKWTPDAFLQPRLTDDIDINEDQTALGSGARPIKANSQNSQKTIDFKSSSVASYLGFKNISNSQTGVQATFTADALFLATIENDAMLVLLDNIPLESYDGFKKGRKNILASIPNPVSGSRIVYEPNNLNYIELNNANTISLRNIRARILYQDYTPLKTKGFSVLNILIDEN